VRRLLAAAVLIAALGASVASYLPAPPGRWLGALQLRDSLGLARAVLSEVEVSLPPQPGAPRVPRQVEQPLLSVYQRQPSGVWLRTFLSPGSSGLARRLVLAVRTAVPFLAQEHQQVTLVGVAHLLGGRSQQLILHTHVEGADCGRAAIWVLGERGGRWQALVTAQNDCSLRASVAGSCLLLIGPYYLPTAPLYHPTVPQAVAVLSYDGATATWEQQPPLFEVTPRLSRTGSRAPGPTGGEGFLQSCRKLGVGLSLRRTGSEGVVLSG
jgi:hypothetical protein